MQLTHETVTADDTPAANPPGPTGDLPPGLALLHEELLSPAQAARHRALRGADGRPCHLASVYRWMNAGARAADGSRVVLESIKCPAGRRTSAQAIERFIHKLTHGAGPTAPPPTTAAERRRQRQVDGALDRAGIG
jgi:hypothetical protein